jgi:hypothetical protein
MISISDGTQGVSLDANESALLDEISIEPTEKRIPIKSKAAKPSPFARKVPQSEQPPPSFPVEDGFDMFTNPNKRTMRAPPPPEEFDGGEDGAMEEGGYPQEEYAAAQPAVPSAGYKSIEDEKADLLNKITRLKAKGLQSNARLSIYSDVDEIRTEYKRMIYSIEVDRSIKFQRRMLVACITGIEFLNEKFDPFDLELNGWSQNVMENVDDYDGVFEELYNKYKDKVAVAPEIKLMFMVGGSAMMFHLSKSLMKVAMPNPAQMFKQNPDLMRNMMESVQKSNFAPPPETRGDALRREMRGPGMDFGSLMGMMGPPPPQTTRPVTRDDMSVSDIVSIDGASETKEVSLTDDPSKKKRGRKPKGKEVTI